MAKGSPGISFAWCLLQAFEGGAAGERHVFVEESVASH
jgi:hypothetical protein